jgi:serine/threonine protein kinase
VLDLDFGFEVCLSSLKEMQGIRTKFHRIHLLVKRCAQRSCQNKQVAIPPFFHPCNVNNTDDDPIESFFAYWTTQDGAGEVFHWCYCPGIVDFIFGFEKELIGNRKFVLTKETIILTPDDIKRCHWSIPSHSHESNESINFIKVTFLDGDQESILLEYATLERILSERTRFGQRDIGDICLGKEYWWSDNEAEAVMTDVALPTPATVTDIVVKTFSYRGMLRRHSHLTAEEFTRYQRETQQKGVAIKLNNRLDIPEDMYHLKDLVRYFQDSYQEISRMYNFWEGISLFNRTLSFKSQSSSEMVIRLPVLDRSKPFDPFLKKHPEESMLAEIQVGQYLQQVLSTLPEDYKVAFLNDLLHPLDSVTSRQLFQDIHELFVPTTSVTADMFNVFIKMPFYHCGSVFKFLDSYLKKQLSPKTDISSRFKTLAVSNHPNTSVGSSIFLEHHVRAFAKDAAMAYCLLHRLRIAYLDGSLENWVFRQSSENRSSPYGLHDLQQVHEFLDTARYSLIDFGQCRWSVHDDHTDSFSQTDHANLCQMSQAIPIPCPDKSLRGIGKLHYFAPETSYQEHVQHLDGISWDGRKIDVWQLGICIFILITGRLPFPTSSIVLRGELKALKEKLQCEKVSCAEIAVRMESVQRDFIKTEYLKWISSCSKGLIEILPGKKLESFMSPHLFNLLQSMLCVDPNERFTMEQVLKHSWFSAAVSPVSLQVKF